METKNGKLISVIMAAYEAEKYIAESIESIREQTWPRWELVICDDASSDGTYEILQRYAEQDERITVLRNERNLGAAAARNRCIRESRGDYIAVQDGDDVSEPDRLAVLMARLARGGCDFVSSGHYLFDDGGRYGTDVPREEYPDEASALEQISLCLRQEAT